MKTRVEKIAAAGLLATGVFAVSMIVHLDGQQQSNQAGDFRNAAIAEIRDSQGAVLLRGNFAPAPGDEDEVERLATLTATEHGGAASGKAEIEYRKDSAMTQEVEFEVTQAPPHAVLTLVIDGTAVVNATADQKGRAEAEVDVAISRR